jgi:hypothetical protein
LALQWIDEGYDDIIIPKLGGLAARDVRERTIPSVNKAWSQNLGHENVLTTFSSYGDVARHRQAEIIRALGKSEQPAAVLLTCDGDDALL